MAGTQTTFSEAKVETEVGSGFWFQGLPGPPPPPPPPPGRWIPGPGGPGRLAAQFRDFGAKDGLDLGQGPRKQGASGPPRQEPSRQARPRPSPKVKRQGPPAARAKSPQSRARRAKSPGPRAEGLQANKGPLRALTCRRPEKGRGYPEPQLKPC